MLTNHKLWKASLQDASYNNEAKKLVAFGGYQSF